MEEKRRRVTLSRGKAIVLAILAASTAILTLGLAGGNIFAAMGSLLTVGGVPVKSDVVTTTTTAPPNVESVKVLQAGAYRVSIESVKTLSIEPAMNSDGYLRGFYVSLKLRAPNATTVAINLLVKLVSGEVVSSSIVETLAPGTSVVYVPLPQPVDPDDVVSVSVNAIPK